MKYLQIFLINVLSLLALLGCRKILVGLFAFFPPKLPSYTFRTIEKKTQQKFISKNNSPIKTKDDNSIKANLSDIDRKDSKLSILNQQESELRFHRVSSQVNDNDYRPYKIFDNVDEQFISKSNSKTNSKLTLNTNLKFSSSRQIEQTDETQLIKARYSSPYKLNLITKERQSVDIQVPNDLQIICYHIKNSQNNTIACMLIQNMYHKSDYIIIHSHQNSPDMGYMLDSYLDLSYNLNINLIGYDYSGFGQSSGTPYDITCIYDIQAVYDFVINELGFNWSKIILYGQSIGSGPSITLAAQQKYPVAGLIVHSGLLSGYNAMFEKLKITNKLDIFPNYHLIKNVNCLVYILHGKNDIQISFKQVGFIYISFIIKAKSLAKKTKNLYKLWAVEEGGHNNIEKAIQFRLEYFLNLRNFILEIININSLHKPQELVKQYRADFQIQDWDHIYNENFFKQDDNTVFIYLLYICQIKQLQKQSRENSQLTKRYASLITSLLDEKTEIEISRQIIIVLEQKQSQTTQKNDIFQPTESWQNS